MYMYTFARLCTYIFCNFFLCVPACIETFNLASDTCWALQFKSWRDGDWQRRRRSLPKHLMPWALFQNPWISHFRHSASSHVVPAGSATASKTLKNPKTFPLNVSENEEVDSRPSDEAPNLITQRNSHNQDDSSIPISSEFFPLSLSTFIRWFCS